MALTRLSPNEFDTLAENTNMEDATRAMARAVLVDGRTGVQVANEYGTSRQRVFLAVSVIRKAFTKRAARAAAPLAPVRESWVRAELDLPGSVLRALEGLGPTLRSAPGDAQETAVKALLRGIRRAMNYLPG